MKNTDEKENRSLEETEHGLTIILLGFRGACPFLPAEEKDPAPQPKKEPVRSRAELEALEAAYYAALETDLSVSIAEMARLTGVTARRMREKLNKYPERFRPENGRVSPVRQKEADT
jgi:hypothetical protein